MSDKMDPSYYRKLPIAPLPNSQALHSSTFHVPPLDGSLSLPEIFDWQYEHSPDHPVFRYADDAGNITVMRMAEVVRAIHRAARHIAATFTAHAPEIPKKPLIAILSAADSITSFATLHGVLRAGYAAFPISTRNSVPALVHLLGKTEADHLIVGRELSNQNAANEAVKKLKEAGQKVPHISMVPLFEDLYYDEPDFKILPPFHPDIYDLVLYLHSSGSTAFPKPIPWTYYHQLMMSTVPFFGERDMCDFTLGIHPLPMYHGMGVVSSSWSVTCGAVLGVFQPQSPSVAITPENTLKAAIDTHTDILICVPTFMEIWSRDPHALRELQKMKGVMYGGATLQKEAGDIIRALGVDIFTLLGFTEAGVANMILPMSSPMDWEYFAFTPNCQAQFVPAEDGKYDLVIKAGDHGMVQVINTFVDGVGAYDTKDLLVPHPTMPGYWRIYGRLDDQIMHSTGEKTNPTPLERILNSDPHVRSCVMFGRGRFNAGIIIDPRPEYKFDPADTDKLAEFRNAIWPTIERMNEYAPQHSRVFKEMITVASPSKPFEYTAKNDPRRLAIIKQYDDEINALYEAVEESAQSDLAPPASWSYADTMSFVRAVVSRVLEHPLADGEDLFHSGCDSLQATWIRNSILHALRQTTKLNTRDIPGSFVYKHPTIGSLAKFISAMAGSGKQTSVNGAAHDQAISEMLEMVKRYSTNFPTHVPRVGTPTKEVVLVTGTTGGLGASLLATLVQSPDVARVYALNRRGSTPLAQRQKTILKERGFDEAILESRKLVLLECKTEEDHIGLTGSMYEEIRNSITLIIHNAWPVNFNLSLSFFEPNVKTVRQFIDLALTSPHVSPAKLLFISSVGVIMGMDHSKPVPEAPVDASVAVGTGYNEAKWAVEKLLETASSQTALRAAAIRLGQITGTSAGAWKETEWLPSMIKSSVYLGCLPTFDQEISWIPVDVAARAVFEMRNTNSQYLHLAHPRPVPWSAVMGPLSKQLGLPLVPYQKWFSALRKSGEGLDADSEVEMMRMNPALKILDFFTDLLAKQDIQSSTMGMPPMDTSEAESIAPALSAKSLPQLSGEDAARWVAYWKRVNFL